jgi:hypothetical protein
MVIMKKIKYLIAGSMTFAPFVAFAENNKTLTTLVGTLAGYMDMALKLLMGFAVLMFVYYVVKYFIQPNDKHDEAAQYVMWSLIGFFIILSLWGLVNILIGTFDLGTPTPGTWTNLKSLFPR